MRATKRRLVRCAIPVLFSVIGYTAVSSARAGTVDLIASFNTIAPPGWYETTLTFTLPAGSVGSAELDIASFTADSRAVLELNGSVVSETGYGPGGFTGESSFSFTEQDANNNITSPQYFASNNNGPWASVTSGFVAGVNTLDILVNKTNDGILGATYCYQGTGCSAPFSMSFEGSVTAAGVTAGSTPEPSGWAAMLAGLAGMGAAMRLSRRKLPGSK